MVDQTAGSTVVMGGKKSCMARDTFPPTSHCRQDEAAVGHGVVTGGATACGMHFTCTDEWRTARCVAAGAVGGWRGGGNVLFDLGSVVVIVAVEVARMTLGAGATVTTIDCGIAVAIDAIDQCAVDTRMTEEAVVDMDCGDYVTAVAVEAKRSRGDGAAVVMAMRAAEVACSMTLGTG